MHNHGNYVASVSELGRFLAEQAEEAGAAILPETVGEQLLVDGGRVVGVRTGDKGQGRDGEPLGNFEPGSDIKARATVLAEGTQGHLAGVGIQHFGLEGSSAQVWALGVKEVWRVAKPLKRVIHTMGWPLRNGRKYREFGGSFIYPMGDDMVTVGLVVGLDYRDVELSVHDLLQQLKTHKLVRKILDGGERLAWGAKTIPEGGYLSLPRQLHAPGMLLCGDSAGFVNVPALKGIHYAIESGRLAAEAVFAALQPGETPWRPGALGRYDEAVRDSFIWKDLRAVRNMRPAFASGFWLGGMKAGMQQASFGHMPHGDKELEPDADATLIRTRRAESYPAPTARSRSTSSPRSTPPATGRATTSRTTSASSLASRSRSRRCGRACALRRSTRSASTRPTRRASSTCRSRRRTASSAGRSPPRADASRRPRAARGPSTRSPSAEPPDVSAGVAGDPHVAGRGGDSERAGPAAVTSTIRFVLGSIRVSVLCSFSATQIVPSRPSRASAGVPGTGKAVTFDVAGSTRSA